MGRPDLKSNDARRPANNPHISRCRWTISTRSSTTARRTTSDCTACRPISRPTRPIRTCRSSIRWSARVRRNSPPSARRRSLGIRLSFHPSQFIRLEQPGRGTRRRSIWIFPARRRCWSDGFGTGGGSGDPCGRGVRRRSGEPRALGRHVGDAARARPASSGSGARRPSFLGVGHVVASRADGCFVWSSTTSISGA